MDGFVPVASSLLTPDTQFLRTRTYPHSSNPNGNPTPNTTRPTIPTGIASYGRVRTFARFAMTSATSGSIAVGPRHLRWLSANSPKTPLFQKRIKPKCKQCCVRTTGDFFENDFYVLTYGTRSRFLGKLAGGGSSESSWGFHGKRNGGSAGGRVSYRIGRRPHAVARTVPPAPTAAPICSSRQM